MGGALPSGGHRLRACERVRRAEEGWRVGLRFCHRATKSVVDSFHCALISRQPRRGVGGMLSSTLRAMQRVGCGERLGHGGWLGVRGRHSTPPPPSSPGSHTRTPRRPLPARTPAMAANAGYSPPPIAAPPSRPHLFHAPRCENVHPLSLPPHRSCCGGVSDTASIQRLRYDECISYCSSSLAPLPGLSLDPCPLSPTSWRRPLV